ncbi:MAG: sugar phosphate isomerase/epimerase [Gammaproteobacteria bacterium]|nr:sugar phosphate isomerase/epimerase [Gammaproteobacteria bacterium]MDH4254708.1 sugar phosphate isomerase/epimerase [Gammaproteobacteria bacterium]MDH5308811.1 sugar phosphate isomerase/epimerase [Gammaproteobacteria bacterium]
MQVLRVYQSLWAMEQRIPGQPEASMREHFARIRAAGYDGVCIDLAAHEIPEFRAARPLYEEFGLGCMINAFPHEPDELAPLLALACEFGAVQVNVIGGVMPLYEAEAVPVVRHWMAEANDAGIRLLFETHRDSLLNDLYYTLRLIDLVPEMRLCADLSHFVVDRELRLPLPERDARYMRRILERADCFQGRVANREQVQVQIDFPQHQEWVAQFRDWWTEGMRLWRARSAPDAELVFLCELGPRPYAITDGEQRELSDRWAEALTIREWVREIWRKLDEETADA